ncbi:tripartite motif-containing protein 16-like [Polymixia lowei]
MAQQGIQMDQGKFCCSICLDILRDPVTIPCGHSYCMGCIKNCWDEEDQKGIHSCPQCRQTFIPRPAVVKNTMLAELVEELEKTGLQAAPLDHCYAGPGDVACDVCTGRKLKALKFCQVCLVSYCEQHLQSHYDVAPLRKHKLVEASTELQENICSRHDEVMKIFCRTDQQCICYLCAMDEHKGHDTISAATAKTERQKELCVSQKNILERIQKEEKDMKVLQEKVEAINCSADKAVENSDRIFTELIRSIERRRSEVKEQIRTRQKAEVSRTEELQKQKEQQIAELRRRNTELELLSHTEDHIHFLQKYLSLSCLSEYKDLPSTDICPLQYFEDIAVAMSKTRDKVEDILKEEVPDSELQFTDSLLTVTKVDVLLPTPPESTTRRDYLRYSCQITLDPNTANDYLTLSKGNRKVKATRENQLYPHHAKRFIHAWQVLSIEGLTGCCYWELKWSGEKVLIAVSYKNINKVGNFNECGFGNNDKSWALQCSEEGYTFKHNRITTPITGPQSSRVGVYLDYRAGTLCFYSVSGTMTLLHRVQTTFIQPLYPGVWLGCEVDTAELCLLK